MTIIEPPSQGDPLLPWAKENADRLRDAMARFGAVILRGFQVDTPYFSDVSDIFAPTVSLQNGQVSPRTQIHGSVYTSTNFPKSFGITQHHELCYDVYPPRFIFFYCKVAPIKDGQTMVTDARAFYESLPATLRERFERHGVQYIRRFTPENPYKNASDTFLAMSGDELAKYCHDYAIEIDTVNGYLQATQTRGAFTVNPHNGMQVFFNVAHLWHWTNVVAASEGLSEDAVGRATELDRERAWADARYGDGTPIEESVVQEIHGMYADQQRPIEWEDDDVVLIDNVVATHGRRPFDCPREIQVTVRGPTTTQYRPIPNAPTPLFT